jgi:hypothetical protein
VTLLFFTAFFMSLVSPLNEPSIDEVRNLYENAATNKHSSSKLNKLLENTKPANFLLSGYQGAAMMIAAKYAINPLNKLSYFKKGKNILEAAINNDPNHIELRYLRLTIQTNIPSFMGYDQAIKSDKSFIINQLAQLKDQDLRNRIVKYLHTKNICTSEELKRIGEWKIK